MTPAPGRGHERGGRWRQKEGTGNGGRFYDNKTRKNEMNNFQPKDMKFGEFLPNKPPPKRHMLA
jgi:hypothetical protein